MINIYSDTKRFVKGPIYFWEIYRWARCGGPVAGLLYIVLTHRKDLDRSKLKTWFTIPRQYTQGLRLGVKVLRRLRGDLIRGGLVEVKRNPGGPYQYRVIASGGQSVAGKELLE